MVRGDKLVEYREDMGQAKSFTKEQFRIPGGVPVGDGHFEILHNVGELCEIADALDNEGFDYGIEPLDSKQQAIDEVEETDKWLKGHSVYGPLIKKQRTFDILCFLNYRNF